MKQKQSQTERTDLRLPGEEGKEGWTALRCKQLYTE